MVDTRPAGDLLDSGATGYHSDDFTPGPKASQGKSMLAQNPRTLEGEGIAKLMSPRSPFYSRGQRPGLIEQLSQAGSTRDCQSTGCFAAHRAVARVCRLQEC